MMRTIHLHGHLREKFGATFRFDVRTAGEAVRALHVNFPNFRVALEQGSYAVVRGDLDEATGLSLELDDINGFQLGAGDLHIVPAIAGSKEKGGFLKILLGILLVGAAIFFSGGALGAAVGAGMLGSAVTWGNIAAIGVSLILSGVSRMLSPTDEAEKKDESYMLSGPTNTYGQGSAVPLVYGEVICGSVMISAGLDIEDIEVVGAGSGSGDGPLAGIFD